MSSRYLGYNMNAANISEEEQWCDVIPNVHFTFSPTRFPRLAMPQSQIRRQDADINSEVIRKLANHLSTERLLPCQHFGDH